MKKVYIMKKIFKYFLSKIYKAKLLILFVIILFLFALLINHYPIMYNYINTTLKEDATREIDAWFYFLSGAGTAALAVIAWVKFDGFYEQSQANFLLHIDDRWG